MNLPELQKHCTAFLGVVDSIFGVYLDATLGFDFVYHRVYEEHMVESARQAIHDNPEHSSIDDYLAAVNVLVGDPNTPDAVLLHAVSQREYGARNRQGGDNHVFLGNVCLVSIYQFWEDQYRQDIAAALDKAEKNELRVPVMGDLRYLRQSIIHNSGIAVSDVERCEVLRWFRRGERIALTQDQMKRIVREVKGAIGDVAEQASLS